MAVEKKLRITINFYKKLCLPNITWNKKHSSKKVLPITYTLEKRFFAVATLEALCLLSRQSKKLAVYFGLCESSLILQRKEDQINTVCKK